ncbi:hypothetical protein [Vitiosangium sp. GDMCC 1.1324]|uniref:hypothetical protein n=1 Tax=Vitiosangium sp. (strain GDMCC 1.1324) TaxID=2138576 RepID=UPI000D37DEBB|nr:hypothetical protein [Vitiosangium sp. GDMCC 1.1324]PTL78089.1 hypothetical protein DAT35_41480 [Vitiosangium sp. GDMCC 1.1324]
MKHGVLLELFLRHSFYSDARCSDFTLEPSVETARILRNHRCLVRPSPDGVRVLTAVDESTGLPFLPLPSNTALGFHLVLRNDDFPFFSDLTGINAHCSPLFTNAGLGAGASELQLVSGGTALEPGVFANVELQLEGAGSGVASFHISFQAKQLRWAYYCITDLAPNGDDIGIIDAAPSGASDVVLFSDANRTHLDTNPDPSDPIAVQLAARYPGMRRIRMLSDQPVTCREAPRKNLELRRGDESLASSLPNPSVRCISRMTAPQQDVLFYIVKYRLNPFHNP